MSGDHIRWEFAAADDFGADLQSERAFNEDQNSATEGTYRSLLGQLDGGSGTDQNMSLNRGHTAMYEDVGAAGDRSLQGLTDATESHRSGMTRALNRLSG